MTLAVREEILKIDRAVTAYLDEWTVRQKRRHALEGYFSQLREIMAKGRNVERSLKDKLDEFEAWLEAHGELVIGPGVQRSDLETLIAAVEYLAELREQSESLTSAEADRFNDLSELSVRLIRNGAHKLRLEYTPAGLVEAEPDADRESQRLRNSLLERLKGFEDVKAAYKRSLEFQTERLDYFYQDDAHLLTVLDYQLKNLEARPNADDEFFAACLLYFLRQHNYQIMPYLKRFQKVTASAEDTVFAEKYWK